MKLLFLVLLFFVVTFAEEKTYEQEWKDFKIKYNRNYKAKEDAERFAIFIENLKEIDEHNERFKNGEVTYELGINHFADRRPEELRKGLGGLKNRKKP